MAINWTKLEENAKKVAAADKKKNTSGYVGLKSASYVSGNKKTTKKSNSKTTKNNTTKKTNTLKTKSGGKNKTGGNTTVTTGGKNKQKTKAVQPAGVKKEKVTYTKAEQASNRQALTAAINEALKSESSNYSKQKKKDADAKTAARKKATKANKQANATAKREHRSTPTKTSKKTLDTKAQQILGSSDAYNFISGIEDAAANNSLLGIGYSMLKGEKMAKGNSQYDGNANSTSARTARKAGEIVGTTGSYLTAYGAGSKATGKAAAKLLSTKAGKAATEKAAATALGKKAGKEATEAVVKSLTKDAVADATIGSVMDLGQGRGEGLEGKDLAKYMAQQAALNAVLGGAAEAAAPALKAAGKVVKKATDYHWEPRISLNGETKYVKVANTAEDVAETAKSATKSAKNATKKSPKLKTKTTAKEVIDDSEKLAENGSQSLKKSVNYTEEVADTGETVYKAKKNETVLSNRDVDLSDDEFLNYLADQNGKKQVSLNTKRKTKLPETKKKYTLENTLKTDAWVDETQAQKILNDLNAKAKKGKLTDDDLMNATMALGNEAGEVVPHQIGSLNDTEIAAIKDIRKTLKNTPIYVNETVRKSFPDGWHDYHKRNFGRMRLSTNPNAKGIDDLYMELRELYPEWLPDVANPEEQLEVLEKIWNYDVRPMSTTYDLDRIVSTKGQASAEMGDVYGNIYDGLVENRPATRNLRQVGDKTPIYTSNPLPTKYAADELVTDAKTGETFLKETPEQTAKVAENATESLETANKAETPLDRNPIKTDADGKQTVGGFEVEGNSSNLGIVNPSVQELDELFETAESKWKTAYRNLVNRQAAIDDLAKASGNDAVADAVQAVRSASGTTEYILTKNLVSPEGEILLDKSYASLFEGMSDSDRELFNEYAQHLNNISRWDQNKPLDASIPKAESEKRVNEILAIRPDFAQRTADINEWWNTFTHSWLVDTGRMTEDAWQAMTSKYPNYVPAFMPKNGNKGGVKTGVSKTAVGSGTHEAKAGTTLDRIPVEDAFMEQVSQIVQGARKNNLIVNIIDTLKSNPDGLKTFGIAKNADDIPMTNFDIDDFMTQWEKESMEKVGTKVYTISGMKDGQKVMAYVSEDMADAIGTINKIIDNKPIQWLANAGKLITNPVKGVVTQLNPLFILANVSRDIPTALIQTNYGAGTIAKNMVKAVKEIATNGEYWQKYVAMGGKSSGYIKANAGFKKNLAVDKSIGASMWEGFKTLFGGLGEVTESVPRLAEFISSLESGNDVYKALTDAAEVTVNFSRAGEVTKLADAWTLYLNAAVQGLDKFARTMKKAPLKTATTSLAVVGAPYAMLTAYNWANPNYQDLSDRTKQNYFCIPNLMGEVDENGYAKTFIKVPLNREYGTIFASTMDIIAGYMSGEENPWNGFGGTIMTNFVPSDPITDNILAPLLINLPQNEDFAGRSIVSSNLEDVSPQYQYDGTTSGAAMAIARAANNLHIPSDTLKSPQKVDYLLDSYGGYFGSLAQAVSDQGNQGVADTIKGLTIDPFIDRFTADARYSSGVQQAFYDAKEKATTAWNDIKVTTGEKGKEYIEYKTYNAIQKELSDLSKQEKEILNNTSLSNAEKSKRAKAIREQKNEVARGAKERVAEAVAEYEKNPEFTLMTSSQQEAYEKVKGKVSKEDYVEAKQLVKDAGVDNNTAEAFILASNGMDSKTTKAMTSKSAYKKAQELKTAGATQQDVINAAKTIKESGYTRDVGKAYALLESGQSSKITSILVSESAVNRAYALKRAGLTPDQLDTVAEKIDTNNNNRYSNDELNAYLPRANMKQSERYAVFEALKSNPNTYNPYG